eukprot:gene3077-5854_t
MIERIRRVVAAFRQLTPHQIGIVLAIGIIGGLFPVPGLTTIPCIALATLARLPATGHIVVQGINFSMTILNLLSVPYFACLGEALWASNVIHFDYRECVSEKVAVVGQAKDAPLATLRAFATAFLLAIFAWAISFLPVAGPLLYLIGSGLSQSFRRN